MKGRRLTGPLGRIGRTIILQQEKGPHPQILMPGGTGRKMSRLTMKLLRSIAQEKLFVLIAGNTTIL